MKKMEMKKPLSLVLCMLMLLNLMLLNLMPVSVFAEGEELAATTPCAHSGGVASCISPAICGLCGASYGDFGGHSYVDGACVVCGVADPNYLPPCAHSGGVASCVSPAICGLCGASYGDFGGHSYADGACVVCGVADPSYLPPCAHSGGVASCTSQAQCALCGVFYGEMGGHSYVDGNCSVCGAKDPDTDTPALPDTVSVGFICNPAELSLLVYVTNEETVEAQADGTYLLAPGYYAYCASCEGYNGVEFVPFEVVSGSASMSIEVTLEAIPTEPEMFTVSQWSWVDPGKIIVDGEVVLSGTNADIAAKLSDVIATLPTAINSEYGELGISWNCPEYPAEGAFEGTYIFTATLPEGYVLAEGVAAMTLTVVLGYDTRNGVHTSHTYYDQYTPCYCTYCEETTYFSGSEAQVDIDGNLLINEGNFPDANFRNHVISIADGGELLSPEQAAGIKEISCPDSSISDLKGIEYFTSLETLNCSCNQISYLDVSVNTALRTLWCFENNLSELDVSANTALVNISCDSNFITKLNLSGLSSLCYLNCSFNYLTALDVSGCTALNELNVYANRLSSLNVSSNSALTTLNCGANTMKTLDLSANTNLSSLTSSVQGGNVLSAQWNSSSYTIDLSALVGSGNVSRISGVEGGSLDSNGIMSIAYVPVGTRSTVVAYSFNTGAGVDGGMMIVDVTVNIPDNGQSSIGINSTFNGSPAQVDALGNLIINEANFPDANFRSYISTLANGLMYLSEAKVAEIKEINCPDRSISNLKGIEYFTSLETLNCSCNYISYLDLSRNTALKTLWCFENSLSELNLSTNTALENLSCGYNNLAMLNLNANPALRVLDCAFNSIGRLDVSGCTALSELNVYANRLSMLDVSRNTDLTALNCGANTMKTLDLSSNTNLSSLTSSAQGGNTLSAQWDGESYTIDLSVLVGSGNLSRISSVTGGSLDGSGILALEYVPVGTRRTVVAYNYNTGAAIDGGIMTVDIAVIIPDNGQSGSSFNGSPAEVDPLGNLLINEVNFPDANFRSYISTFATRPATWLTEEQVAEIKEMNCPDSSISDLKGIEYFTSLETLNCSCNYIGYLDLSRNTALRTLWCFENSLSELNVSANTALENLSCGYNNISSIDLSTLASLKVLNCSFNNISSLDLSGCPGLENLNLYANRFEILDVSGSSALASLSCGANMLRMLNLSSNTALSEAWCGTQGGGTVAAVYSDGAYTVDLGALVGTGNTGRIAAVTGGTYDSSTGTAELSYVPEGTQRTVISYNYDTGTALETKFMEVNLTVTIPEKVIEPIEGEFNGAPAEVDEEGRLLINESNFPDEGLREIISESVEDGSGMLSESNSTAITSIDCSDRNISSLKGIEYFSELETLNCASNNLSTLDLSACDNIAILDCSDNNLTWLNLENNDSLIQLNCGSQTAYTMASKTEEVYYVDMGELVGKANIGRIRIISGGNYDSTTGILTISSAVPDEISAQSISGYVGGKRGESVAPAMLSGRRMIAGPVLLGGSMRAGNSVNVVYAYDTGAPLENSDMIVHLNVKLPADVPENLNAAKEAVAKHRWIVEQTNAGDMDALKRWIEGELEKLDLSGASAVAELSGFTAAQSGSAADKDGTNGSFSFTVNLSKGSASESVTVENGVITATGYTPPALPAHQHKWESAWSVNDTHHWHRCLGEGACDAEFNAKERAYGAHAFTYWKTVRDPSPSLPGMKTRVCLVCGYTQSVLIPIGAGPMTGDSAHPTLWLGLMTLALGGFGCIGYGLRRRKNT